MERLVISHHLLISNRYILDLVSMKTASQRLRENALNQLSTLAQLEYLANSREPDGKYFHWGLARMYGGEALQQSMSEVHSSVFIDVLRKPIPELADEIGSSAQEAAAPSDGLIRTLSEKFKAASPENQEGGCEAHLKMVLYVLSCLTERPDHRA
jgi:hypothetical protein